MLGRNARTGACTTIPALRMLLRSGNYVLLGNQDTVPEGQDFLIFKEKDAPAWSKELSMNGVVLSAKSEERLWGI
jgi:hypothetical protein